MALLTPMPASHPSVQVAQEPRQLLREALWRGVNSTAALGSLCWRAKELLDALTGVDFAVHIMAERIAAQEMVIEELARERDAAIEHARTLREVMAVGISR